MNGTPTPAQEASYDLERLRGGLIVSCQAPESSPLHGPEWMASMAEAAKLGGAVGIRANGVDDVRAITARVGLPVIGLLKRMLGPVYITPTVQDALDIEAAGAHYIAVDGTLRRRHDGTEMPEFLETVISAVNVPVIADVDSVEAARAAAGAGVTIIATTLSGYSSDEVPVLPDIDLVEEIRDALDVFLIAEGRYRTLEQVAEAFARGADAVVAGGAVTDPVLTTRHLLRGTPRGASALEGGGK